MLKFGSRMRDLSQLYIQKRFESTYCWQYPNLDLDMHTVVLFTILKDGNGAQAYPLTDVLDIENGVPLESRQKQSSNACDNTEQAS